MSEGKGQDPDSSNLPTLVDRPRVPNRAAVSLLYLAMSLPLGSWLGRIPDVKQSLAVGDQVWGLVNTLGAVGELFGFLVVVMLIGRVSTRKLTIASTALVLLAAPLAVIAPSLLVFTIGLFSWMVVSKIVGTTMGALALVEQKVVGRPLMGRFDAVYSIGMLLGGALAWVAIQLDVPPVAQLGATNAVLLVGLFLCARWLPDEEASPSAGLGLLRRLQGRLRPQLLLLAGISLLASIIDSVSSQWAGIFVTDMAGGDTSWGAVAYTLMMATKTLALLVVDAASMRLGWRRVVYASMVGSAVAFSAGIATGSLVGSLAAFAAIGIGTSCLGPMVNSQSVHQAGVTAGEARTVLEMGELPAYILTPAVVGVVAETFGLVWGLALVVPALLMCAGLTTRVGPASAEDPVTDP